MIDPNRLARLILDEWQDTEQPIEQRGTILPLGIYEDGSAHLAIPGLINDGIEGWNALWDDAQAAREGAYPTFDVEQGKRSAGNSLMAAGLAATGGLAAGAAGRLPDNALASNAIRGGGDRAPAALRAYRGASSPDDLLNDGPLFASSSPAVADGYAGSAMGPLAQVGIDDAGMAIYGPGQIDGGLVAPLDMRFSNPMRVDAQGSSWTSIPYHDAFASTDSLAARAKALGHDGLIVDNIRDEISRNMGAPSTTYAALRPGTVFSATTGEQLFSNPKTSALAPAIVNALEDNALASNAVRLEGSKPNFQIMVGDSPAGRAYVREWPDTVQLGQINVDPNFRRQGIATEAQKQIAELHGKPTVPDVSLSESEYLRWVKNDPAAVADYEKRGSSYSPRAGTSAFYAGYGGAPVAGTRAASGELFSNPKSAPLAPAAVNALDDSAPRGIIAYHGSPHDFDKFSLDKIGTGEGAQAYGHGLYFAENEGVAKQYRDQLSAPDGNLRFAATKNSSSLSGLSIPTVEAARSLLDSVDTQISALKAQLDHPGYDQFGVRQGLIGLKFKRDALADLVQANDVSRVPDHYPGGRMYEVNINADPESFLDWDLPISQQSEAVQRMLDNIGVKKASEGPEKGWRIANGFSDSFEAIPPPDNIWQWVKENYPEELNTLRIGEAEKRYRSDRLKKAGIPGIRYKDAMSRGGEGGTNNYVVFDDALVEILRKYANPPTAATVPLGLSGQNESDDDFLSALLSRYGVSN